MGFAHRNKRGGTVLYTVRSSHSSVLCFYSVTVSSVPGVSSSHVGESTCCCVLLRKRRASRDGVDSRWALLPAAVIDGAVEDQ